jgi:hypothetical protein
MKRTIFGCMLWLDLVGSTLYVFDSRWVMAVVCLFGAGCAHVVRVGSPRRRVEGVL